MHLRDRGRRERARLDVLVHRADRPSQLALDQRLDHVPAHRRRRVQALFKLLGVLGREERGRARDELAQLHVRRAQLLEEPAQHQRRHLRLGWCEALLADRLGAHRVDGASEVERAPQHHLRVLLHRQLRELVGQVPQLLLRLRRRESCQRVKIWQRRRRDLHHGLAPDGRTAGRACRLPSGQRQQPKSEHLRVAALVPSASRSRAGPVSSGQSNPGRKQRTWGKASKH